MGFATTAAIILAGASLGATVYQGEKGAQAQRRSLKSQENAQNTAYAKQEQAQRKSEEAMRAATKKSPDVAAIMGGMRNPRNPPTMLSGTGGVDPASLTLGRTTLLGE